MPEFDAIERKIDPFLVQKIHMQWQQENEKAL
jgi:hypothetical protein